MNRRGPPPSEWVWAGVILAFVIIAGILFFSIDDPALGTIASAAALLAANIAHAPRQSGCGSGPTVTPDV